MGSNDEFDICWFDLAIAPDILYRIKPYQRISQWPGIQSIAHKNKLAKNVQQMQKEFPEDYGFLPQTFILPSEISELKAILKPPTDINDLSRPKIHARYGRYPKNYDPKINSKQYRDSQTISNLSTEATAVPLIATPYFILKPEDWSKGKGIYLANSMEEINLSMQSHMVA